MGPLPHAGPRPVPREELLDGVLWVHALAGPVGLATGEPVHEVGRVAGRWDAPYGAGECAGIRA